MTCRLCGERVHTLHVRKDDLCPQCDERLLERAEEMLERRSVPVGEPNWEQHLRARRSKWSDGYLGGF